MTPEVNAVSVLNKFLEDKEGKDGQRKGCTSSSKARREKMVSGRAAHSHAQKPVIKLDWPGYDLDINSR